MTKTDTEIDVAGLKTHVSRLERVLVFSLIALLFFLGVACAFSTFLIQNFERIFSEMLGDKPLPVLTRLVIDWGRLGIGAPLCLLLPLGAGLFLFFGRVKSIAWWTALAIILFLLCYLLIVNFALYVPMITIITEI